MKLSKTEHRDGAALALAGCATAPNNQEAMREVALQYVGHAVGTVVTPE